MSLFFYGVCIVGVVLGGLVLVLYSLLVMTKRGDECLDQLELEMLKTYKYALPCKRSEKPDKLRLPTTADLSHGGTR